MKNTMKNKNFRHETVDLMSNRFGFTIFPDAKDAMGRHWTTIWFTIFIGKKGHCFQYDSDKLVKMMTRENGARKFYTFVLDGWKDIELRFG